MSKTTTTPAADKAALRQKHLKQIDKARFASAFADVNASVAVTVDFVKDVVHVALTTGAGIDKNVSLKDATLKSVHTALVDLTAEAHEDLKAKLETPAPGLFIKAIAIDSVRAELRRQVHASSKARKLALTLVDAYDADEAARAARKLQLEKELASLV